MTREDNDTAISNKERAELATEKGADITVRIHANGDNSSTSSGALTMAPTSSNQYLDQDIIEKSNTLASCIINHYCDATGLGNLGVISSDNMTGTNWSTVPVAILEMGFMSNQNDDLYITNSANHETMAKAVAMVLMSISILLHRIRLRSGSIFLHLQIRLKKIMWMCRKRRVKAGLFL